MQHQSILHTVKRYSTSLTHKISVLPIAILMPHSACNCRCVMCDIWKGNKNTKQLSEDDVTGILGSLKKLDTKRVVMSGGEALLNRNFFLFCEWIQKQGIQITLLSTGLTIERNAAKIIQHVDEVIVSLDGDEILHNKIRNINDAYSELRKGVRKLKELAPGYAVSARCVIHRLNFRHWDKIIFSAKEMGLDRISFLPADVTSEAFNRSGVWEKGRQDGVLVSKSELRELEIVIDKLVVDLKPEFDSDFIAESPEKIRKIYQYYAAHHGIGPFPSKKCNAPWVSAVVEADGTVRPCFFHDAIGSIKHNSLDSILNQAKTLNYRKQLNTNTNPTCEKCVCYLNLSPRNKSY